MKKISPPFQYQKWLIKEWSRASLLIAAFLLSISPLIYLKLGIELFLVFLQLPFYMVHQYEEHALGRFKQYANRMVGRGKDVLTDEDILFINLLLVWALDLGVLYLAAFVNLRMGLIAGYLSLLNGISHVGMGIIRREYNPGFWSSLFLLVPAGGMLVYVLSQLSTVSVKDHLLAGIVVMVGHAAIMIRALVRLRTGQSSI